MAVAIKIRATLQGDVADVKALMNHMMETGFRKDPGTGQVIPAHFIKQVVATLNGKTVLDAQWGPSVSKNPVMGFRVKGAKAGDKVAIKATDTKGETLSGEGTVA
ncbi:MAG: thiosulfate oxidation carrier complex protein SoxZ [Rhodocyclales bacterium GWA2_65_20]|nr:MAG: thiosulfate oxidation carrier complex protein SoxZ [Rhodocyclales bacterium GWA2_65_20]